MYRRSNGLIFLGLILLSIVFVFLLDLWATERLTSGSHQKRMESIRFQHFASSGPVRHFGDHEYLSEELLEGRHTLFHNNTKLESAGWQNELQTQNVISALPVNIDYKNKSISDGNITSPNVLCGCGRCFKVILQFRGTGHIFVDINAFNNSVLNTNHIRNEAGEYSDISYFVMKLQGDDEIWSTLVSDKDVSIARLEHIRVSSSGKYNVSLTLIYRNRSSAYGLEKYQTKELHCPLCQTNGSSCHITLQVNVFEANVRNGSCGWVPITPGERSTNKIIISDHDLHAYFRSWKTDKTFFKCPTCEGVKLLDVCLVKKRFMLLGDSHMRKIWNVLQKHIRRVQSNMTVQWRMRQDGHGVYHNLSPDKDFKGYTQGKVPPVFVPGDMIKGLQSGLYYKLQQQNQFDAWIFTSGHWDLRDTSVDEYISHLEELFEMWSEFQRTTGVWLVWNGIPAYSFNRYAWEGMEKRTNIKIGLADHETKDLCKRYNITYVPFF